MYRTAFRRLPEYLQKPNNEKLYDIGYAGFDELKGSFYDIQNSRNIDNATGYTLDLIGLNVGQKRPIGMTDDEYRLLIKVKIVANKSDGNIPTINEVAHSLFGSRYLGLQEMWKSGTREPAAVMLFLKAPIDFRFTNIVNSIKSGGVRIYWSLVFEQDSASILFEVFTLSGEEVTIYPDILKEPETYGKLFSLAYIDAIAEDVEIGKYWY